MILVIGGAYQGKLEYAMENFGVQEENVCRCTEDTVDFSKTCIAELEQFTLACTRSGKDARAYLEENRDICLCAMHSVSHEHLRRFFQADIYDIIHRVIDQLTEDLRTNEAEKDILTHFYVSALAGTVESWLLGELPYTPETLVAAADRIIQEHITGALIARSPEKSASRSPEL